MKGSKLSLALCVVFLVAAGAALAQEAALVTLKSEVLREVTTVREDGTRETRLVPADRAMPGEVLVFRITYHNEGSEPADNVALTNPVPEHMTYVEGSASGKGSRISFSTDGGKTFGPPEDLFVRGEDGKQRLAQAADYTHIRWQLTDPVPPGGEGAVSFQAKLK